MALVLGVLVGVPVLLCSWSSSRSSTCPSLARGERVAPGATGPQDQWLGGRRDAGELEPPPRPAPPDAQQSDADTVGGGASARW